MRISYVLLNFMDILLLCMSGKSSNFAPFFRIRKKFVSMRRYTFLFLALVTAVAIRAEVSLDSCRVWAEQNYPLSRQYGLVSRAAEYNVSNASRMWIPRFTVSAQGTWQSATANMSDVWSTMGLEDMFKAMGKEIPDLYLRPWQGKVQLDVQQTIWDGGASMAQKRIARADAAADEAEADVSMYELRNRVDQMYLGILLLDKQEEQLTTLMTLLNQMLTDAQTLYTNEMVLQSDVDGIEVELLTTEQKQTQLQYARMAYRQMLSLLCGRDLTAETLAQPIAVGQLTDEKDRPEMRLLDAQEAKLNAREKALWVPAIPQIGAFAQGWYGYPKLNMFESMQSSEWGLNAVVGVQMRWNIGGFYTISNDRKKIANGREQLQLRRELFTFNRNLQRQQENSEVLRLSKIMEGDEKIVRLRASVREAAEVKFRNGTISATELMRAVSDETHAKSNLAIHEIELIKAKIAYEK